MRYLQLLIVLFSGFALAQQGQIAVDYYGNPISLEYLEDDSSFGFANNREIKKIVAEVVRYAGITQDFDVKAKPGVVFAVADIVNKEKVIAYDPAFFQRIDINDPNAKWIAVAIVAHEIGHHVNNHFLELGRLTPEQRKQLEIEADKYSGRILYRMGATVEQARLAIEQELAEEANDTHPGKRHRLVAVENAWYEEELLNPRPPSAPLVSEPSFAILSLTTEPSGVGVYLDGHYFDTTPIINTQIGLGSHTIRLAKEGYETREESLFVEKGIAPQHYILTAVIVLPPPVQPTPPLGTVLIARNADWQPVRQEFTEGTETTMVLVPVGSFRMGSTEQEIESGWRLCNEGKSDGDCPRSWIEDEGPTSIQNISKPYWIDETEVTRAAYGKCVAAGVCEAPPESQYSTAGNQPINRVTWYQAATYCEWRGARLPTEMEWEYAARGPDNLLYPWGNNLVGNEANHCDSNCKNASWYPEDGVWGNPNNNDGYEKAAPVGSYPNYKSWVGALDMSGNVWEWTSSLYKEYPYVNDNNRNISGNQKNITEKIALRGGSFDSTPSNLRAASRDGDSAGVDNFFDGFRCARSNSVF